MLDLFVHVCIANMKYRTSAKGGLLAKKITYSDYQEIDLVALFIFTVKTLIKNNIN